MTKLMKLIVGLGNPGSKFKNTRHNLGWAVIDELAEAVRANGWQSKPKLQADVAKGTYQDQRFVLLKPRTFMNKSGLAVRAALQYYKIKPGDMLVIHDEADLPLGEIRVQEGRGSAGHNGVQSIINELKTQDFTRIRVGISPTDKVPAEQIILRSFSNEEQALVREATKKAVSEILAAAA